MRSIKARIGLENLETRALLTQTVQFLNSYTQVVNDKVGTVDVEISPGASNPGDPPVTVTVGTVGGSAVPGVDYTPTTKSITVSSAYQTMHVAIPILPGPASLGTRVLQVSISPASVVQDVVKNGASAYIIITHGSDTTDPYIVNSQALTKGSEVVAFSLQFSKPMAIGPVTNLANYAVAVPRSGMEVATALFSTFQSDISYSGRIPLKLATYDAATNTVYLIPVSPLKPKPTKAAAKLGIAFQVGVPASNNFSNLTDASGNPIASDDASINSLFTVAGNFLRNTMPSAEASPSTLSYLFGTPAPASTHAPAHPAPKVHAKPVHKVKPGYFIRSAANVL